MRARDRMRQAADRRNRAEAIVEAVDPRFDPAERLFIREEMLLGWAAEEAPQQLERVKALMDPRRAAESSRQRQIDSFVEGVAMEDWQRNMFRFRSTPDPDPAPGLPAKFRGQSLIEPEMGEPPVALIPDLHHPCPACNGSGYGCSYDGARSWTCYECGGYGSIERPLFSMELPTAKDETNE